MHLLPKPRKSIPKKRFVDPDDDPAVILARNNPIPYKDDVKSFGIVLVNPRAKSAELVIARMSLTLCFFDNRDEFGNRIVGTEFHLNRLDLTLFKELLSTVSTWKTAFIFKDRIQLAKANGGEAFYWLGCYLNSFDAHKVAFCCRTMYDHIFHHKYTLPCGSTFAFRPDYDHPASIEEQYQAWCVRHHYHDCPNLDFSRFRVIE